MVIDYIIHLKKRIEHGDFRASSCRPYFFSLKIFYEQNDIILNWKKLQRFLPEVGETTGDKPYTTEDIKKMLDVGGLRSRAIVHYYASTGGRTGSVYDLGNYLKMKHLKYFSDGCIGFLIYPGTKSKYHACLTPEAGKALKAYFQFREKNGEVIAPESPVFRNRFTTGKADQEIKPMQEITLFTVVANLAVKAGIRKTRQEKFYRHEVRGISGFRIRFDTILKSMDNPILVPGLVEKMMGHNPKSIQLDKGYSQPDIDTLHKEFDKAVNELTIDQSMKFKRKLEHAEIKKTEFAELKEEVKNLTGVIEILMHTRPKEEDIKYRYSS